MHNFKRFSVFTLASASSMLEASKEKTAHKAAEPLVVGFSCKVEAQVRDFAVVLLRSAHNSDKWQFNAWFMPF